MSPEDRFLGTKEIFLKDYFYSLACFFLAFNISIHMYIPFKNSLPYKLDDKVGGGRAILYSKKQIFISQTPFLGESIKLSFRNFLRKMIRWHTLNFMLLLLEDS